MAHWPESLSFSPSQSSGHAAKQLSMRRRTWAAAAICSLLVLLLCWSYLACLAAIVYNYAWWVLFSSTVRMAHPKAGGAAAEAVVPMIIHQTWRNGTIPAKWQEARESCATLHPDYKHMLWTDADAERLVADKFPWFLDTYRSYPHNIQRADALRYFVLYEHGGIYLDLDIKCLKSLDFLRYYNFTAPKTYPIGLSNDILVSRPKDPFALRLIHNLAKWNRQFAIKYTTVMFSTGPMFVTVQYVLHAHKHDVTMLAPEVYGKYRKGHPDAAMQHLHGSSWHGNDAKAIFWLEAYWLQLVVAGSFLVGGVAGWLHGRYGKRSTMGRVNSGGEGLMVLKSKGSDQV